jgi:hypothetical protein
MADVFIKPITTGNIVQGAAHVFINTLNPTQKIDPEKLDDEAASGIINFQGTLNDAPGSTGILDSRFDNPTYYSS